MSWYILAAGLLASAAVPSNPGTAWKETPGMYAVIETNQGTIVAQLFPEQAPKTVDNFVGLAEATKEYMDRNVGQKVKRHFYDGLIFHRVIPGFMMQGGDPTGTGRGDPGYRFEDEIVPDLKFNVPGRLAMANSGPNTNGSQFFITQVPTEHLNGRHTIFGQVVEGMDVVNKICGTLGTPSGAPKEPVTMKKVTIKRVGASGGDKKPAAPAQTKP